MKESNLQLVILLTIFSCSILFAETILYDDFTVTSSGDVNIELTRQTGLQAPLSYFYANGPSTVTNEGIHANKCHMDGTVLPSYLSHGYNFKDSSSFSFEFAITRFPVNTSEWTAISFFTEGHYVYPHESTNNTGMEIILFEGGGYQVFDTGVMIGGFAFAELNSGVTPTLNVRFVASQPDFSGSGETLVSLFINGKPYPIINQGTDQRFLYMRTNSFTENYISFLTLSPTTADIDNFKFTTFTDKNFETAAWTDVADSGISSSKVYTHAVNFCNEADVNINSVTFKGSPSNNIIGTNWELKNDQNLIQLAQYGWGANANLSSECIPLVSNCLYDAWTSGGLTLKNLETNLQYIITLYSMGLDPGSRPSYFIPSDGDAITVVDQNQFGDRNGQILTYKFTPSANGIFSIATKSERGSNWVWYAFSNEIIAPEDPTSISASQGTFSDKVRISWNAAVGAQTYTIFRAETNLFSSATELVTGETGTSFDDSTATLKYYYYWVKADSAGGSSSEIGPALGFISASSGPSAPSNISPTDFEVVNVPVIFTASAYSGSNPFGGSEWQVSENSDFSYSEHSNWKSGTTIPTTSLTIPGNAIGSGTNYWRVRYMNKFANWSSWSSGTSFIFVPGTNGPITFFDNFNVAGYGDVNKDYTSATRQSGNASPLTYKTQFSTEIGSSAANPGELTLGQNSGCSPNKSFEESTNFKIEFDVKPHEFDGSDDWFSLCFGKANQNSFMPQSSGGAGLVFKANGEFSSYDADSLLSGGSTISGSEKIHVVVTVGTEDFDGGTVIYSVFADAEPMISDAGFGYIDGGGFNGNYITMFSKNSDSANSTVVDNFSVREGYKGITVTNWTSDADSFVDPLNDYTHHVNLSGGDVDINGVEFIGAENTIVSNGVWQIMSSGGTVNFFKDGTPNFSDSSFNLAKDFCWWGLNKKEGNSAAIKLFGLTPFSSNTMTIYTYGFDASGPRAAYFSSSSGGIIENIDQNTFGQNEGLILQYDYVASKDGTFTLVANPLSAGSFHISAFSNIETGIPEPGIVFSVLLFGLILKLWKK